MQLRQFSQKVSFSQVLLIVLLLILIAIFAFDNSPVPTHAQDSSEHMALNLAPDSMAMTVWIKQNNVPYGLIVGDSVDFFVSMRFVDIDNDFQTRLPNEFTFIEAATEADAVSLSLGDSSSGQLDSATVIIPKAGNASSANSSVLISPSEEQRPRQLAARSISNAQVLAMGEANERGVIPVTVAVSPQDAVILTYIAEAEMEVYLGLRSANAEGYPNTDPVSLGYIMARFGIVPPDRYNYSLTLPDE